RTHARYPPRPHERSWAPHTRARHHARGRWARSDAPPAVHRASGTASPHRRDRARWRRLRGRLGDEAVALLRPREHARGASESAADWPWAHGANANAETLTHGSRGYTNRKAAE